MPQETANWLPARTGQLLQSTAKAAEECLTEDFVAAVLVGNAMHPERATRAQRPEVLVVAKQLTAPLVRTLASALQTSTAAGVRPRLVTREELRRSADVFALELAEWKARHWLIAGDDPFEEIEIDPAHLRHALEFQLRGLGRRLRNRVFLGLSGHKGEAGRAVMDALDTVSIAAHHTLVCLGQDAPLLDTSAVTALGEAADLEVAPVLAIYERSRSAGSVGDAADALGALVPFIERLTRVVDDIVEPSS